MPTRIDYIGIEAFIAIAQMGNFVRAASHLNLSQAALSHRVRKLEADIGTRLFLRTTREVSLTEAGQQFLPMAQRNLEGLSTAYEALQMQARVQQETLTFACLPTIAHYYLPPVLDSFVKTYPKIGIRLQEQPAGRVTELVISGEAEFGVILAGARRWDLEFKQVRREPYNLLVSPNHRLAEQKTVCLADLAGERFVRINTQSTNRQMVDDFLGPVAHSIDWRFEVQNATMAVAMVMQGAAVTVLPSVSVCMSGGRLVGLPFSDLDMSRTLGIVTRKGAPLSVAALAMQEQIIKVMGDDTM
jgi:DNA-binding transcriptional LysR family regulator|tara:strand:+ start:884 stop:1786 length:903 start_codon:yes stop_codon:yes gene_type:complete